MDTIQRIAHPKPILLLCLISICSMSIGAVMSIRWTAAEVTPIVLVKPGIAGFVPEEGTSIGNTWSKDEVKPVLLLKPGIAGFEPREGSSIGNSWTRGQVIPVILVEPSQGSFVPLHLLVDNGDVGNGVATPSQTASAIESQIDRDFEGWSGETIFKLTNGQIWQQSEYDYEYEYAYRPKAVIFKTDSGFKMKVEDMKDVISVKRLTRSVPHE